MIRYSMDIRTKNSLSEYLISRGLEKEALKMQSPIPKRLYKYTNLNNDIMDNLSTGGYLDNFHYVQKQIAFRHPCGKPEITRRNKFGKREKRTLWQRKFIFCHGVLFIFLLIFLKNSAII